jgi:hypothetical protein
MRPLPYKGRIMEETLDTTETTEDHDINFGAELAKTFAISAAVTGGMLAGLTAYGAIAAWRERRSVRKAAENLAKNLPSEA